MQHYAFLIDEKPISTPCSAPSRRASWALRRILRGDVPDEINRNDGGRGVYFPDPDGHLLEVITRPYGSGG